VPIQTPTAPRRHTPERGQSSYVFAKGRKGNLLIFIERA
jgi:hypothetical protein